MSNEQEVQSDGTANVYGEYFNRIAALGPILLKLSYPIRTDRILIRVTSASKSLFTARREAHEFAPDYMSARWP